MEKKYKYQVHKIESRILFMYYVPFLYDGFIFLLNNPLHHEWKTALGNLNREANN